MIANLLQSIGIVFTLLIIAFVVVISMYLSYIIGVSIVIIALIFITYHITSALKKNK
jgi:hypothetical protein